MQGEAADLQGQVTGVLGTRESPLNQELAQEFGFFPMDWRELAMPRKGGVIVEAFNADEVNRLNRKEKGVFADDLSYRIAESINRSGVFTVSGRILNGYLMLSLCIMQD